MWQKIKNWGHWVEAVFWAVYYRFPGQKLTVVGVTGTDGKTTTVNLIHHILTAAGIKAGICSTLSSAHTTTPHPKKLQRFLADGVKAGWTHAVLEVSSHAIDQHRIWGIPFAVGVLTNIADNEHLDYHGSFENYRETKLRFLKICRQTVDLTNLTYWTNLKKFCFQTKLLGNFNRMNCLAAIGAAKVLGIDEGIIRKAVASFESLPGRLQIVVRKPYIVIVDFAHTPQAFQNILPVVREIVGQGSRGGKGGKGRLVHVFGCTGDRDKSKRPMMGEIAARYDDVIVLTHEDTYSEEAEEILGQIEEGLRDNRQWTKDNGQENRKRRNGGKEYFVVLERKEAIKKALELAKPGDVVLLTGVGHQKSLNIGGKEVPWDEPKIVKELLDGR